MLEIADALKKHITNVVFMVVGDGEQLNELRIQAKQKSLEKTVFFAGSQIDMRPFYKDSKITLICSIKEGLALTTYESLSMGVPVVSADVGGQSELIDDMVGAVIPLMQDEATQYDSRDFNQEEISLYVETLNGILSAESKYTIMRATCRARIVGSFSTSIMLTKLVQAIHSIISDEEMRQNRLKVSESIGEFSGLTELAAVLYSEVQLYDTAVASSFYNENSLKNELARIANTRFGRILIKIALLLRLNKLFK